MKRLEVSGAVRPICGTLGVKRLICEAQKCFLLKEFKELTTVFHTAPQHLCVKKRELFLP